MIIVKIKAGLGNQMFQYACGRALALRNNDELKLDLTNWSLGKEKVRSYLLSNFNIVENIANDQEMHRLKYPWGEFPTKVLNKIKFKMGMANASFNPKIIDKKGDIYLDGFWQSEKYFTDFADQIRKDFQLKKPLGQESSDLMKIIKGDDNSVSVHIRRGDAAHKPTSMRAFGCTPIEYYEKAIDVIAEKLANYKDRKINIYVFSDEISWSKENLRSRFKITFVSRPGIQDYEEIILMSACRHNIISNSTFSWWGAWLNQQNDKIIVAPKRWALQNIHNYKDIIPTSWIRI